MKSTTDLIQEYKALFDEGTLTLDEYNYLKKRLLDQGNKEFTEETNILDISRNQKTHEKWKRISKSAAGTSPVVRDAIKITLKVLIPVILFMFIIQACVSLVGIESSNSNNDDYNSSYDYGSGYDSDSYHYNSGYDSDKSSDYDDWDTDDNGQADWHDVDTDNDGEVSSDEMNKYMEDWAEEESEYGDW